MLFQETETPGVYRDEKGEMWPLGADMVTKLRNNGNVFMGGQSSGGGGGAPPGLDPRGRSVQAVPAAAGGGALGGAPMGPPTPSVINPSPSANLPPRQVPPGLDPRGRSVQAVPQAATPPMRAPMQQEQPQQEAPQLQRVMPRDRGEQQQAPQGQRYYKQVGSKPGEWVDTVRQTSGWTPEEQDAMRARVAESHKLRTDAANMQYQSVYHQAEADKVRAQADQASSFNKLSDEQRKLDTQNLYIESQQKKVAASLKAARERTVDPTKPFQGGGGLAGVLAVLGATLGEYSSKVNGGPNNALMLFNNMIDRSVDEQLRLINEEKEGALMSKDDLDSFQFRNNEEKKALIRAIETEHSKAKLDEVNADKALAAVHPLAAQMRADIDDRQTQDLMTINNATNRTSGQRYQQETRGGVADITEQVLAQRDRETTHQKNIHENQQAMSGGGAADKGAVLVNGQVIGKTTDAAAKELNDQYRAYVTLKQKRDQAVDMIRNGSFLDDSRYEALTNDAMFDLAGAKGATIRSDTDVKQFGDMLGGTSRANIRPENQIKIWNDNVRRAGTAVRNSFRQRGLPTNDIEPDEMLPTE